MAAFDATPWLSSMSSSPSVEDPSSTHAPGEPPTVAAFSPTSAVQSPALAKQRSTILVHQKSPLLVATPPQVTRALAYSHPFLLPLNKLAGLLSWTTGDPWESFLLVATFWALVLYGDFVIRFAGPIVFGVFLIVGMYSRRYSPLSSTGWTNDSKQAATHARKDSEAAKTRHHKSLDEIVETLKVFTSRCNILLDPFLRLTDFLSTQRTATSATTRPALTSLFVRILLLTPVWLLLTLPPLRLITTKRVVLCAGTLILAWHSRPAIVARTILWRSNTVRRMIAIITGLSFAEHSSKSAKAPPLPPRPAALAAARLGPKGTSNASKEGVRLTWSVWENERRWIGLGWTHSMLAYERAAWTDDQLNPAPSKEDFTLPPADETGVARWRWCDDSHWTVEGTQPSGDDTGKDDDEGWLYYDNKWRDGRRGQDGWGRYTRRRRWVRDAELVEVTPSGTPLVSDSDKDADGLLTPAAAAVGTPAPGTGTGAGPKESTSNTLPTKDTPSRDDKQSSSPKEKVEYATSVKSHKSTGSGSTWFRRRRHDSRSSVDSRATDTTAVEVSGGEGTGVSGKASGYNAGATSGKDSKGKHGSNHSKSGNMSDEASVITTASDDDEGYIPMPYRGRQGTVEADWGVGDDVGMGMG